MTDGVVRICAGLPADIALSASSSGSEADLTWAFDDGRIEAPVRDILFPSIR